MYSVPKAPLGWQAPPLCHEPLIGGVDKGDNMTTQEAPTTEEATEETSGGGLRKKLTEANAKVKDLEAKERKRAFADAGFDVETGMGKAVARTYDGDPEKDSILKFALDEYGYQPAPAPEVTHPQAEQISLGQAQLDQVGNVAGSEVRTTREERLVKARQDGDYGAEGAIMAAQMQDMMDRQARP